MGIFVRTATDDDLPGLPVLELAADSVFTALGMRLPPETGTVGDLRAAQFVLVAALEPDGPPVGCAVVELHDGLAHLGQLSVHPDAAQRGVGSALLEAAARRCAEQGFTTLSLSTFADVAWNGPFYRRRGFVPLDEVGMDVGPELRAHLAELSWLEEFGRREVLVRPLTGRAGAQDPSTHRQNGWPAGSV